MQRISALKQNGQQEAQSTEYREKDIHRVIATADSDSDNLMKIKSNVSDKVYSLHLEFTADSTGIGEEIREILKERFLENELKSGARQTEPLALQCTIQDKEEMEDNE